MPGLPTFESGVRAQDFGAARGLQVRTPEADSMFQLADIMNRVGGEVTRGTQEAMSQSGAAAGQQAMVYETDPATGQARLRPLDQLLVTNLGAGNQAYNQAILRSYAAGIDNDARTAFARFQTENQNNPTGFAAAAEGWITGTINTLPERARPEIGTALRATASQFALRIHEDVQRAAHDQLVGNQRTAIQRIFDDTTAIAMSSGNRDDPRIAEGRQRLNQALEDGRVAFGADFTPDRIRAIQRQFEVTVESQALAREVLRGGVGPGALARIDAWRQREDLPFSAAERDQIAAYARGVAQDRYSQVQMGRSERAYADNQIMRVLGPEAASRFGGIDPTDIGARRDALAEMLRDPRVARLSPEARDAFRLGVEADINRQEVQNRRTGIAAAEQADITRMMEENRRAAERGVPLHQLPNPMTALYAQYPAQYWPTIAAQGVQIANYQQQLRDRIAAAEAPVLSFVNGVSPVRPTAEQVNAYVQVGATPEPSAPLARRPITDAAQLMQLFQQTGVMPSALERMMPTSAATMTFAEAQRATQLFSQMMASPAMAPAVRESMGDRAIALERLAGTVEQIARNNSPNGTLDPNAAEQAWQRDQANARQRQVSPDRGVELVNEMLQGQTAAQRVQANLAAGRLGGRDWRPTGNQVSYGAPVAGPFFMLWDMLRGVDASTPAAITDSATSQVGPPQVSGALVTAASMIPGAQFVLLGLAGSGSYPIDTQHVPAEFSNEIQRTMVQVASDDPRLPLDDVERIAYARVGRSWGPSVVASRWSDRAEIVRNPPERVAFNAYGIEAPEFIAQIAAEADRISDAYRAAGRSPPFAGSALTALMQGTLRVQTHPDHAGDTTPLFVLYAEPPAGPDGQRQQIQALLRPDPNGQLTNREDARFWMPRRDLAAVQTAAERERIQQLAYEQANSTSWLQRLPRAAIDAYARGAEVYMRTRHALGLPVEGLGRPAGTPRVEPTVTVPAPQLIPNGGRGRGGR